MTLLVPLLVQLAPPLLEQAASECQMVFTTMVANTPGADPAATVARPPAAAERLPVPAPVPLLLELVLLELELLAPRVLRPPPPVELASM